MLSVPRQRQTDTHTHTHTRTHTQRQADTLLVVALVNQTFDPNLIPPIIIAIHRQEGNNMGGVTGQSKRGREREGREGEREREREKKRESYRPQTAVSEHLPD